MSEKNTLETELSLAQLAGRVHAMENTCSRLLAWIGQNDSIIQDRIQKDLKNILTERQNPFMGAMPNHLIEDFWKGFGQTLGHIRNQIQTHPGNRP